MTALEKEQIDFACYPIDPRLESHTLDGIHEFLHRCHVKHCLAIHFADQLHQVKNLIQQDSSLQERVIVLAPNTSITI